MVITAKGAFSNHWVAIYTKGTDKVYGNGPSEEVALAELRSKVKEYNATRSQKCSTDSANN